MVQSGGSVIKAGLCSCATLPYSFRFLWPFLVDHVRLPVLSRKWGQRKAWGVVAHAGSLIGSFFLCILPLSSGPFSFFSLILITSFFSSVLDMVSDICRFDCIDSLRTERSVTLQTIGFRAGQLLSISLIPIIAHYSSWFIAGYALFTAKLVAFLFFILFNITSSNRKEEKQLLEEGIVKSFKNIVHSVLSQKNIYFFLVSIILLRIIDVVCSNGQTMFVGSIKLSDIQFGALKNGVGMAAMLVGVFSVQYIVPKITILKSLQIGVCLQSLSCLLSLILMKVPATTPFWNIILASISLCQELILGFVHTAYIVYLSFYSSKNSSIYFFTFFSTLGSLVRTSLTPLLALCAAKIGWEIVFFLPISVYIPLFVILRKISKTTEGQEESPH
jgi:PAT family beta-lactamase induction signal transducer AmpG